MAHPANEGGFTTGRLPSTRVPVFVIVIVVVMIVIVVVVPVVVAVRPVGEGNCSLNMVPGGHQPLPAHLAPGDRSRSPLPPRGCANVGLWGVGGFPGDPALHVRTRFAL